MTECKHPWGEVLILQVVNGTVTIGISAVCHACGALLDTKGKIEIAPIELGEPWEQVKPLLGIDP